MIKVIGIRFKKAGKIYYFDPADIENIQIGDFAVVETARGVEYGEIVIGPREVEESAIFSPLKRVLRIATEEDKIIELENKEQEKASFSICEDKIKQHNLEMKLIDVEYTFDRNKVIFYFTADGRVDFRELVKDLAAIFKTRIELRQIGVRDEAKMLGGMGICGRPLCCASFLGDFQPVSIKMAKEQSLSLNPTKISGICGRLMCCLKYEQDVYEEVNSRLPKPNSIVLTPRGEGIIINTSVLRETVTVRLESEDGVIENVVYPVEEVTVVKAAKGEVKEDIDVSVLKYLED